jgi:hypothetical protein
VLPIYTAAIADVDVGFLPPGVGAAVALVLGHGNLVFLASWILLSVLLMLAVAAPDARLSLFMMGGCRLQT